MNLKEFLSFCLSMPQNWKNYILGIIALLAIIGSLTLGEKFFATSDTPDTIGKSTLPKPEKATEATEKVRLLIRSEDDGEPIENVTVEFAVSNGPPFTKTTGTDGYTELEIPQGVKVVIRLSHKDYVPRSVTINSSLEPGETKPYLLKRKPKVSLSSNSIPSIPEPTITGKWEGTYTCSLGITGVLVDIDQTGNSVSADFSLYPVPTNPKILKKGVARYEGDFNSTSRRVRFSRGTWIDQPYPSWVAFGFQGQFDENLEEFSGTMDHRSCKTINLKRKDS
jgi:hypothetical protein